MKESAKRKLRDICRQAVLMATYQLDKAGQEDDPEKKDLHLGMAALAVSLSALSMFITKEDR